MGCRWSEVQILSPRPANSKGSSYGTESAHHSFEERQVLARWLQLPALDLAGELYDCLVQRRGHVRLLSLSHYQAVQVVHFAVPALEVILKHGIPRLPADVRDQRPEVFLQHLVGRTHELLRAQPVDRLDRVAERASDGRRFPAELDAQFE